MQMTTNSWESITRFGWGLITGTVWDPVFDVYGALPFIWGTVVSSLVALSAGRAAQHRRRHVSCPKWRRSRIRRVIEFFIEILAAIPSVVYGLWGMFVLIPFVRDYMQPLLQRTWVFCRLFQGPPFGYGMLTAGIIWPS